MENNKREKTTKCAYSSLWDLKDSAKKSLNNITKGLSLYYEETKDGYESKGIDFKGTLEIQEICRKIIGDLARIRIRVDELKKKGTI